jgi:glyoxylase-like metal-dependent hydrolase (beta-lactamase superfamily II)
MTRVLLWSVAAAVLIGHAAWVAAQGAPPARTLRTEQVRGDLHMISGDGGNVAAYVTTEGVILVDDMYDRNHAALLEQVRRLTDRPLRYVINTHQHDDHAGGAARMLPIADVIAHRNVRINLEAKKQPFFEGTPGAPIGLPRVTFTDEASVFLGNREVRALHFGRAHTNGDVIVYFPELRAIHTGDVFLVSSGGGPGARAGTPPRPPGVPVFIDYAQGGSFLEWSRVLDGILSLDFDVVVPGHGPVATRADVAAFKANLEIMRTRLTELVRKGTSRTDLVSILERDYGWRSTGCPPSPPTAGCLQYQQVDALIEELRTRP